jgi:hypothetical protein
MPRSGVIDETAGHGQFVGSGKVQGSRRRNGTSAFDKDAVARALEGPSRAVRYWVARAVRGRLSARLAPFVDQAREIESAAQSTLVWAAEV